MTPITEEQKLQIRAALDRQKPTVYHDDISIPNLDWSDPSPTSKATVERVAARFTKAQLDKRLLVTKEGKLVACLANALDLLRFEWQGVLAFNQFLGRIVTKQPTPWGKPGPWADRDDALCLEWLERKGLFLGSSKKAAEAVAVVAQENSFHPVKDYFRSLRWDGKQRLESLFPQYARAEDTPLNRAAGRIFMISMVARVESPGCQADTVVLLIGKQGSLKSSFCREICPQPEYFSDHTSELGSKDSRMELEGKILIEFAELDRVKGKELGRVKAFLTTRKDSYRPPYGRATVDFPRSCVFVGTSNDEESFADETGNRRFLPIHVGEIDMKALAQDKTQLWAEAFSRYNMGARWHLDTRELTDAAKEAQDGCYASGQWDSLIEAFLDNPQPRTDRPFYSTRGKVILDEVLSEAVGKAKEHWTLADRASVVRCLVHNGYRRRQVRIGNRADNRRQWVYILEGQK